MQVIAKESRKTTFNTDNTLKLTRIRQYLIIRIAEVLATEHDMTERVIQPFGEQTVCSSHSS